MTTKVVKGSLWTLLGQILPLFATLVSTPFIIRFLGAEQYGVLILVGLIPNYFSFVDFGMGVASTKFSAEAYGKGLAQKEGEIVRTAASIAFLTTLLFVVPVVVFSHFIMSELLQVPAHLQAEASLALKITAVSFLVGVLNSIFNTPQLSRLRMDLNTFINAGTRIFMSLATPVVLYLGGGVVEAALAALLTVSLGLICHLFVSGKLLPELFRLTIDFALIKPLIKYGGGIVISSIALVLLANFEKLTLSALVSVKSLAYYSVAYTFANMATMFSAAMMQSLLPAFSQLLTPDKRTEFNELFSRMLRLNIIWLLPAVMFMIVIAKPFFTVWAGEDFGRESILPFYILLFGLFFNVSAYVPYTSLTASGRTDITAKLYWVELIPFILTVIVLTYFFGIIGAAVAWSLRVIIDAICLNYLAYRVLGVSFNFLTHLNHLLLALAVLSPPVFIIIFLGNDSPWLLITPLILAAYSFFAWQKIVSREERLWLKNKFINAVS
jgi:O-antigen/teichoic acid export membrane protein